MLPGHIMFAHNFTFKFLTIKNRTMLNHRVKLILPMLLLVLLVSSCKKNFDKIAEDVPSINNSPAIEGDRWNYQQGNLQLGKQLQNPYTISNMTAAYAQAIANGAASVNPVNIRVTHYYVKYKPANQYQYDALEEDTTLELYDYPLDYEIVQEGNRYHDPSLPDSVPTYQYCTVPLDYNFNDSIQYDILASMYIPEVDETLDDTSGVNEDFVDELLDQAYILTSNYDDTIKTYVDMQKKAKWRPRGKIQINDTRIQEDLGITSIPLVGVKVRARRWFLTYTDRTNQTGDFATPWRFRRAANYSLKFSTPKFAVKEHFFGSTCWIEGPKNRIGDWDYTIQNGYDRFVGHIFRGAYTYNYGFTDGLQRPTGIGKLARQYYSAKDNSEDYQGINFIAWPLIKIARYDDGVEYGSDEIYSTTIHETAHSSHRIIAGLNYFSANDLIRESWALGVEWRLTHIEYANRGIANYGETTYSGSFTSPGFPNTNAYQFWNRPSFDDDYTSLFINLQDNFNDRTGWANVGVPDDNVSGYILSQIETDFLSDVKDLNSLSTYLKFNKPPGSGVTDGDIDQLLSFY